MKLLAYSGAMNTSPTLGRRIRHFRQRANLTLDALSDKVGLSGSQLSIIENGKREPKIGLVTSIAAALGVSVATLLETGAPDERSAKELELDELQHSALATRLGIPATRVGKTMTDETLDALLGLHREIVRRETTAIATPEEARRANTELRLAMRDINNYRPDLEEVGQDLSDQVGHTTGALTHREMSQMAARFGLEIIYVDDLPESARSITDWANGLVYLPPASIPGGHGLRSMAIQAIAHRILEHDIPASYPEFLQQRLEINYVAAAAIMPRRQAVEFLSKAKADRNIAVEDFRDAFGVTHEVASMRFTNLATSHLDIPVHFLRVGNEGAVYKAYENDGLPIPTDVTGSVEGQRLCRNWSARVALERVSRTTEYYQYTDTPEGTFWESTQTGSGVDGNFSITVGVPFTESKWFRGRETGDRKVSTCPDPTCCVLPSDRLAAKWAGNTWTSAAMHSHVLTPVHHGTFPGVDDRAVFEFLERHAAQ
jgi:transcriptional regulator with XRE-family HTH domain